MTTSVGTTPKEVVSKWCLEWGWAETVTLVEQRIDVDVCTFVLPGSTHGEFVIKKSKKYYHVKETF